MAFIIATVISTLVGLFTSEVLNWELTGSFVLSTVAYGVAYYYAKRYLDD